MDWISLIAKRKKIKDSRSMYSSSPLYSLYINMKKRVIEGRHNEVFNSLFSFLIEEEREAFRVGHFSYMWLGPKLARHGCGSQSTKDKQLPYSKFEFNKLADLIYMCSYCKSIIDAHI